MNKRSLVCVCQIALLVFIPLINAPQSAGVVQARSRSKSVQADTAEPASAIIELESDPVGVFEARERPAPLAGRGVDFESSRALGYESRIAREHQEFLSRASLVAPNIKVRAELRKLANAVSVEAGPSELASLSTLPGVKRVQLTKEYHSTLDTSVPLIKAPVFWDRLGGPSNAGEGMKIAILDTGIDISNPMFDDTGFSAPAGFPRSNNGSGSLVNNKVIVAKSFLTGSPVPNAQDQNGHGSNVAGIAAGDLNTSSPLGPISGVAPRAFLGNYRVLNASGSGRDDKIAQAMEEAVADGFDVLSMSLGADADAQLNFLDQTVEAAVNVGGKIVVIAAGNSGNGGTDDAQTIGSPGVAPSAITVAAATNGHVVGPTITVTGPAPIDAALTGIAAAKGIGSSRDIDGTFVSMQIGEVTTDRACGTVSSAAVSGKIALIERGNCSFVSKVNAAAAAGARAVIVYNQDLSENPTGGGNTLVTMDVTGTTIPSVFITRSAGLALRDFVRANPTTTVNVAPIGSGVATADVIADFSSRGPTVGGVLKPDITAPGVIIYSAAITTPNADGVSDPSGFDAVSGTSQATPHVAGSAALVKQQHPSFTPLQVKSALMNSAVDGFLNVDKTAAAGVLAEGAGRVDLDHASSIDAIFAPASLSLGIKKLKKKTVTIDTDISITGEADGQTSYSISVDQLDPDPNVSVNLSTSSLMLNKDQTGTVTFTIVALKKAEKRDYTGFIVFNSSSGQTLRVPYWVKYRKKG